MAMMLTGPGSHDNPVAVREEIDFDLESCMCSPVRDGRVTLAASRSSKPTMLW